MRHDLPGRFESLLESLEDMQLVLETAAEHLARTIHGELRSNGEDRSGVQCRVWTA